MLHDPVKEILKKLLANLGPDGVLLDTPIEANVDLSVITSDPRLQIRRSVNESLIDDLVEVYKAKREPDGRPPLLVHDGATLWLCDGHHRKQACSRAGKKKLKCQIKRGGFRVALQEALKANSSHGLRRTNEDKRHAVLMALEDAEWVKWSDRQIAELCGVHHQLVSRVRCELDESSSSNSENPSDSSQKRIGKDGKERSMPKSKKPVEPCDDDSENDTPTPPFGKPRPAEEYEVPEGVETFEMPDEGPLEPDTEADIHDIADDAPNESDHADDLLRLPDWVAASIKEGRKLQEASLRKLEEALTFIREFASKPCGYKIGRARVEHVEAFIVDLKFAKPRAICPKCRAAKGVVEKCDICRGHGFITETTYKQTIGPREKAVCDEYDYSEALG